VFPRYPHLLGRRVLKEVRSKNMAVRQAFDRVLQRLHDHPYPIDELDEVAPLQGFGRPNCYSIPFDEALLAYQIKRDMPAVELLWVVWLNLDSS
jgi:hypothetical protein